MIVQAAVGRVVDGGSLTETEAQRVMDSVMAGEATEAQIAGLLVALRLKGESKGEIAEFARAMQERSTRIEATAAPLVDVCGTGGDARGTFNISTTVAFVAAGAGLAVAKHGNRSVSSQCGSADVLEALGVRLDLAPADVGRCIDEVGIGFLYAPTLHPAMKHAIGPRRELGIRTIFNVLGPLTNPARAAIQLLGVYDAALTEPLAEALRSLGCRSAFVVHGADGLDEFSTTGPSRVARLIDDRVESFVVDPASLGLQPATLDDLAGGDADENAAILRSVLAGEAGARRDIVLLNAAAILVAAEQADDLAAGLEVAAESIDSGGALGALDALISLTQQLGGSSGS